MRYFICILLLKILAISSIFANNANYQYSIKQLSLPDGISSYSINSMAMDKRGTLWLATNNGVNRVYGENIDVYRVISTSGTENRVINHIFCDKLGNIWIITNYSVNKFNIEKNSFFEVVDNSGNILSALSYSLVEDGILFGGTNKIYKYLYSTQETKQIFHNTDPKISLFYGIKEVDENNLIISNNICGIYCINLITSKITLISEDNMGIFSNGLFIDSKNRIWMPHMNNGVKVYTLKDGISTIVDEFSTKNSNITNDNITNIFQKNNELWLTTDGGGLNIINIDSREVHQPNILPNIASPFLQSARSILNDGDLWYIGTTKGGLIALRRSYINNYTVNPYNSKLGPNFPVILSCEEYKDKLWLGTDGGGINIFDPKSEEFSIIKETEKMKITNLLELDDNYFMFSAFGIGLFKINKINHKLTPITNFNNVSSSKILTKIEKIDNDRILILGWERWVYNIKSGEVEQLEDVNPINTMLEFGYTSNPSQHIAYSNSEIYRVSYTNNIALQSIYKSNNRIDDAIVDNNGGVWFSDSQGLKQINNSSPDSIVFHCSLRSTTNSMLCDNKNRIWIANVKGVSCYDINTSTLYIFGKNDDILINDFLANSSVTSSNEDIYLGGIEGLLRIKNDIILQTIPSKELELTTVYFDNTYFPIDNNKDIPSIKAPLNYTNLELKMATEGQGIFGKYNAHYRIKSLFYEVSISSFDNSLTIPKLPSGTYSIEVSKDHNNKEFTKIATLTIPQPIWLRWWAILIYISIIITILIGIYYYTISRKKREMRWILSNNERRLADNKVKFFINLSHELRTPLTLIHAPLKRLLKDNSLTQEAHTTLQRVLTQANHTFNLVNMVLDIRKLENNNDTLNLCSIDINSWIKPIVLEFEYEFKANGITLITQLQDNIPHVMIDSEKCKSVLSNILMNAQKYSNGEGEVIIKSEIYGKYLRISVIDEWEGIDPHQIDSIFNRFYQSKPSNIGYGIGLSYSKNIIELHNGKIGAKNNSTKGATFYFDIPLPINLEADSNIIDSYIEQPIKVEDDKLPKFDTTNMSILVVDDNDDIIHLLNDIFRDEFKRVYSASNGEEALSILHTNNPDIVVSDIMMPKMNGYELCKSLKSDIEISHIPIILLTARADAQSNFIGYKMGADNYITKPFDSDLLLLLVNNELRKRYEIKNRIQSNNLNINIATDIHSNADYKFIELLNEYIITNLSNEELNLDMILQHVCMSRTSFKNKFFAITNSNINISQYINNFRIERAKALLSTSDLSISEVAYLVGFSSVAYFGSIFKKHSGVTPKSFKESNN